jgi:hypothetical protein
MISAKCTCGAETTVGENAVNMAFACANCGTMLRLVCAEQLADGAGAGDFDARLVITAGPARVGECIFLGGVVDIEIGKLAGKPIQLEAQLVSRAHCKLVRIDFGPSRWKIVDNKSTNGLFVNGERIAEQELAAGDEVNIGGYRLEYSVAAGDAPAAVEEEPIVLEEEDEEAPEAEAAPAVKKKKKAKPPAYARPVGGAQIGFLSESDPNWIKKLRTGTNLLLLAIAVNLLSWGSNRVAGDQSMILLGMGATLANLGGAWLLTWAEPEVGEETGRAFLRLALRIVSSISAAGGLSLALAALTGNPLLLLGGLAMLAAIPQFFLLLLYLRLLALRIPSETMASHCLIVMIGFPATLIVVGVGLVLTIRTHSIAPGLLGMCGAACAVLGFVIWYIAILIWFQRSLA